MTRRHHLLRLHENLVTHRERLGKKLAGELAYLHDSMTPPAAGDTADLAFETDSDEISARLAEWDQRELAQIDRALAHWNRGTYGICESCQRPISLARLSALASTTLCIRCEREIEMSSEIQMAGHVDNWGGITDRQPYMQDPKLNFAELEMECAGDRRRD